MENEGCLWWTVVTIVWFSFCGICISADINPIVAILVMGAIAVAIFIIYKLIKSNQKEKLLDKVDQIKAKYPRAYHKFTQQPENNIAEYEPSIETLKRISSRDFSIWETEEKELKEAEEKRKQEQEQAFKRFHDNAERIKTSYPDGFSKWEKSQKKKLAYVSDYSISDAENEIMELDAKVKIEKRQKEETKKIKKEEVENSIKKLPSIVESNDIETIESTIKIIKDNLIYASKDDKKEFENIQIDYNNKKEIGIPQDQNLLYVNYDIPNILTKDGYYAILRMPQKGCVVWPYRRRTIARRGYTESGFETKLKKYLSPKALVLGDVNILPQNDVRPYEPDIAVVYSGNNLNVRIDIEIDEPYAALTNKPIHYIGCGDDNRDANLNCLGWIVIRFSERQVYQYPKECVKYVADIIKSIDNSFNIPSLAKTPALIQDERWSKIMCQRMAAERFRQKYLSHEFGKTEESVYNITDLKLTSFEASILDKVKTPSVITPEHDSAIIEEDFNNENCLLYNKINIFEQDYHISFNASHHIYTVDGVHYKSVSLVISDLFPEFDKVYWSNKKAIERGVDPKQIIEEWEAKGNEAREVGSFMHQQIENYFLNKNVYHIYHFSYHGEYVHKDNNDNIEKELGFLKDFLDETTINPFRSEWRIFDRSLKLAGTIDLISQNNDGSYDIYDWKRSARLYDNNRFQSGLGRLAHLEDTPRNHYYLQQNLYKYILEHQYGLQIRSMKLVCLHPDFYKYDVLDVPKMDNEVSEIIKMM